MANPQTENGHTQIANEILEHLILLHLSPNQWQVLLCIIRKTYGFHKKVDYIANFQIGEATNLCKSVVSRCLGELNDMQLIIRKGKFFGFQKDWEKWQKLAKQLTNQELAEQSTLGSKLAIQSTNKKLAIQSTRVSSAMPRNSTPSPPHPPYPPKDTVQKKEVTIPNFIDKELWNDFLDMRKKIRKPATDKAQELLIKDLGKLNADGNDPNEILRQSIKNSWQGLFPLKDKPKTTGSRWG